MKQRNLDLKLLFSFVIGTMGIISLTLNFWGLYCLFPSGERICLIFYRIIDYLTYLPLPLSNALTLFLQFAFLIFFFLSPIGIFLGGKSIRTSKQKLAIPAIILNIFNFLFSIFIALLIFGRAIMHIG